MPSGSYALYVAILSTLATGAAYVPVEASVFRAGLTAQGFTDWEAGLWTDALDPITSSREAPVLDGVRRALGREPRDFADFVRDAAARGVWG